MNLRNTTSSCIPGSVEARSCTGTACEPEMPCAVDSIFALKSPEGATCRRGTAHLTNSMRPMNSLWDAMT